MKLAVEREVPLLTLLLLQPEDGVTLFITQGLQLTSQLLWKTNRNKTTTAEQLR